MKAMKRSLSILLAVMMALSVFSLSVFAGDNDEGGHENNQYQFVELDLDYDCEDECVLHGDKDIYDDHDDDNNKCEVENAEDSIDDGKYYVKVGDRIDENVPLYTKYGVPTGKTPLSLFNFTAHTFCLDCTKDDDDYGKSVQPGEDDYDLDMDYHPAAKEMVTVTYQWENAPAGAVLPQPATFAKGSEYKAVSVPEVTGWTFDGWYKDNEKFIEGEITKNTTLTGTWIENPPATVNYKYVIKYVKADGTKLDILKQGTVPVSDGSTTYDFSQDQFGIPDKNTTITINGKKYTVKDYNPQSLTAVSLNKEGTTVIEVVCEEVEVPPVEKTYEYRIDDYTKIGTPLRLGKKQEIKGTENVYNFQGKVPAPGTQQKFGLLTYTVIGYKFENKDISYGELATLELKENTVNKIKVIWEVGKIDLTPKYVPVTIDTDCDKHHETTEVCGEFCPADWTGIKTYFAEYGDVIDTDLKLYDPGYNYVGTVKDIFLPFFESKGHEYCEDCTQAYTAKNPLKISSYSKKVSLINCTAVLVSHPKHDPVPETVDYTIKANYTVKDQNGNEIYYDQQVITGTDEAGKEIKVESDAYKTYNGYEYEFVTYGSNLSITLTKDGANEIILNYVRTETTEPGQKANYTVKANYVTIDKDGNIISEIKDVTVDNGEGVVGQQKTVDYNQYAKYQGNEYTFNKEGSICGMILTTGANEFVLNYKRTETTEPVKNYSFKFIYNYIGTDGLSVGTTETEVKTSNTEYLELAEPVKELPFGNQTYTYDKAYYKGVDNTNIMIEAGDKIKLQDNQTVIIYLEYKLSSTQPPVDPTNPPYVPVTPPVIEIDEYFLTVVHQYWDGPLTEAAREITKDTVISADDSSYDKPNESNAVVRREVSQSGNNTTLTIYYSQVNTTPTDPTDPGEEITDPETPKTDPEDIDTGDKEDNGDNGDGEVIDDIDDDDTPLAGPDEDKDIDNAPKTGNSLFYVFVIAALAGTGLLVVVRRRSVNK